MKNGTTATMGFYDFNELKKELSKNKKWILRDICKNLLNSAPVFVVACNYYTEKTLHDFAGDISGAKVIYKHIHGGNIYFNDASYSKGINEDRRKDRSITKFIIYQTPDAQEELKRIREERRRSKTPFDDKYYKKPYSYYWSNYNNIKVDKSGFTSYYQIEELKRKAEQLRRRRQQEQYSAMNTAQQVAEIVAMVEEVQTFTFKPSIYQGAVCTECAKFIEVAKNFIETESEKGHNDAKQYFEKLNKIKDFYADIIDARSEKNLYYLRYLWDYDESNKKPDRTTAHEFRKYCDLYNDGRKTVATSKNGRVKLITIKG